MSSKFEKPSVFLSVSAVCAVLTLVFTDLYYHFYAVHSYLFILFVLGIAACFAVLFSAANFARKRATKKRMLLTIVPYTLVLIVILIVLPLFLGQAEHLYYHWGTVFTYVAFGLELIGYAVFFLLLSTTFRKRITAAAIGIVVATSVVGISCWTALGSSIADGATSYDWALDAPEYEGAHLSRKYNCGVMKADEYHDRTNGVSEETSFMQVASRTDKKGFDAYCRKVVKAGYAETGRSEIESISARTYEKDGKMLHVYYNASERTVRIVTDPVSVSPQAASYAYEVQATDQVKIYQYSLMCDDDCEPGYGYGGGIERCGMNYVIKLADNKLVIIDGGDVWQASDSAVEGFYDLCKEISGTADSEKIEIACWIGTHGHGDHIQFFSKFLRVYADRIHLERYLYNYPNWKEVAAVDTEAKYNLARRLETYASDALPIKAHTGQTFTFGGAKLEILYSHEDAFNHHTNMSDIYDYNDSGLVCRFTFFDKTTFIVTGDLSYFGKEFLADVYTAKTLKCDIVQAAHHGNNFIGDLYSVFDADYVFYPQGYDNAVLHENLKQGKNYDIIKKYTPVDRIFMMNRRTYGVCIDVQGHITVDPTDRPYIGPDFRNGEYFDGSAN